MKRGKASDDVAARDARYASVIAGCDWRVAIAAVAMIETREGLETALRKETEFQARSAVLAAIRRRLGEAKS